MNSRILLTAVIMIAAGFFTSCLEEDVLVEDLMSHQTIVADIAEPEEAQQTRTCVDIKNPNTSFIGLLWQPDDQIGVYSQDGKSKNAKFTTTATQNEPQAEFSGEMSGTPYYAYFPYSSDNDNCEMTSLKGTVLAEQAFNPENGTLVCDYKYGTRAADGTNKFNFKQLFTMLRVTIDASETGLEGERLNNIVLTVTDANGNQRPICGDFTFSAVDGDWSAGSNTSNSISMPWTTRPALEKGKSFLGFITLMPVVKVGDKISIAVITEGHKATFTADSKVDFQSGYVYNIPLTLKDYAESGKFGYAEEVIERPSISSFEFEVDKNSDKLIGNQLTWNSSSHTPSFTDVAKLSATVNTGMDEITLTIPYLYDFKLIPTFTVSGSGCTVKVNGETQVSGETEVDFTNPVTYTVVNNKGASRDYTVKVTNTGLPVVVIEQSGTGDFSDEKVGGTTIPIIGTIGARVVNTFVDFKIRGKETKWVEDDKITVYNADGTVNVTTNGGVRHRGNTSRDYPKKPFAIKTTSKVSMLGMPEHKRWVLLANWLDHSMIRNTVAFDIAQVIEYAWRSSGSIGEGIPWNVHGQNVELVFIENGEAHHVGNYLLCEQIKIDENRLNINEPYDIESPGADDYTLYGHLLEVDATYDENSKFKTSKSVPFMFKDDVSSTILNDVQSKIQTIENNIYNGDFDAAFESLDINSVIDQMLIWELTMNREYGDPKSVYMFMNGAGKLSAGPVWDFDRGTFQNQEKATELCDNSGPEGSSGKLYRIKPYNEWMYWRTWEEGDQAYVWYQELVKSEVFQQTVQQRWAVLKPYLDMIPDQIRYYGQTQAESFKYDSVMWPTSKSDIRKYKSDFNDWSGDELLGANGNYQEIIDNFVTVYQKRLSGMNTLITSGKFAN